MSRAVCGPTARVIPLVGDAVVLLQACCLFSLMLHSRLSLEKVGTLQKLCTHGKDARDGWAAAHVITSTRENDSSLGGRRIELRLLPLNFRLRFRW